MSENTITVDDIVEAHNKTSTGFNDLVRWHTSIVIGAMAMIISSVIVFLSFRMFVLSR